jgi:DnaJ-class molecular chaperone
MERKDYYLILGVSRGENLEGIHDAFRELAKKYHPDRAGPEATGKFQEIQEAYDVLRFMCVSSLSSRGSASALLV